MAIWGDSSKENMNMFQNKAYTCEVCQKQVPEGQGKKVTDEINAYGGGECLHDFIQHTSYGYDDENKYWVEQCCDENEEEKLESEWPQQKALCYECWKDIEKKFFESDPPPWYYKEWHVALHEAIKEQNKEENNE